MRKPILTFLFCAPILVASVLGQGILSSPIEIPTRELAVCYLFADRTPKLFYLNTNQEYTPLRIDRVRFQTWNRIPATKELILYANVPDPEVPNQTKMVEAGRYSLPGATGLERARLLFYFDKNGKTDWFTLEADAEIHAPLQMRVMNLANIPVAISVDGDQAVIQPRSEEFFTPVDELNVRYRVQFAYQQPGQSPYSSTGSSFRFRHLSERQTVIFGYQPVFSYIGENEKDRRRVLNGWEIKMLRFYDRVQ
ncbi:MAG: hypothetical protein HRU10_08960 [Opitutales bacterium]|nr:hypothetical protein [Opitutales bacterium]